MDSNTASLRLQGDWTITGVVRQIAKLMKMTNQLDTMRDTALPDVSIDCSRIEGIDASGCELLYAWLHGLHLRGIRAQLVEIPQFVQESQIHLELGNY